MRIKYSILSYRILAAALIAAAAGMAAPRVAAQTKDERLRPPSITVSGDATVTARPDRVQIDIGVITQAETADAASSDNRKKADAVLAQLRSALGAGADIKTASFSISPKYSYPKDGGQPTIAGYTATNVVRVRTEDLSQVGKLIDLSTQSGANLIQQIQFSLKDERAVRTEALKEAAAQARSKAQAIASALDLRITRILYVDESSPVVIPRVYQASAMRTAAAPTPIEPGTIDVRATISLTVEIAQ
jgi:uncharacterized protein YggE